MKTFKRPCCGRRIRQATLPATCLQQRMCVAASGRDQYGYHAGTIQQLIQRQPFLARVESRTQCVGCKATADPHGRTLSCEHVSADGLPRSAVLGVLGGGQLGRMMALAAANLGVRMLSLDPTPGAPASICSQQILGSFRDPEAIKTLCESSDALTVEIEHVDADALEQCAAEYGLDVEPTPATLRTIQDKYAQKVHFAGHGVPLPDFAEVSDAGAMQRVVENFGFPFMLKAKRLAYDGKGNYAVRTPEDVVKGPLALGGWEQGLYAERWAPFVMELAVMVVRSRDGSVVSYPVVQTVHRDSICHVTEAPAAVPEHVQAAARKVAETAIACLEGAGIFGVEMFLLSDGSILLNEVAPRPHNSGHYTMDACVTSQFENHVRAVLGWPLGDTSLQCGCSIMLNILGEADDEAGVELAHQLMARAYAVPGAKVHWYGKEGVKKGRKVGHINIVARSHEEARAKLALLDSAAAASLEQTQPQPQDTAAAKVGIIMGSDSDLPTMKAAAQILEEFGVALEMSVVSAHRTPERMIEYARSAHKRGLRAIIAGAGGAAHLPGMVAACTPLPVIGVPVIPKGYPLDGVDALLSICSMPKGVPVATVAIGNAANAGLLAVRILAAHDPALLQAMLRYQEGMRDMVQEKARKLERVGWRQYDS